MERTGLLRVLKAREEQKTEAALDKLLQHPKIGSAVERNPALKHVLRAGITIGKIPEQRGSQQAIELLQRALHGPLQE